MLSGDASSAAAGSGPARSSTAGSGPAGRPAGRAEAPARLLGAVPWLFCVSLAAVGVAGVTPLAWIGAGLVAGLSLSGSI